MDDFDKPSSLTDTPRAPLMNGQGPGTLIKEITADLSTLVRKEIELAKQEVGDVVRSKLIAVGVALVVLLLALLLIPFVLLTIIDILDIWLPRWGASSIVTGLMIVMAAVGVFVAKAKFKGKLLPEATIRSLKEDVEWVKHRKR
ncbi:MAG: phage holin family protein [Actinomycetota bacterium]|nr:phage holin family protein [Actinomycetota bacterium]